MKYLFRVNVFFALCALLSACGQTAQLTPSSIPSATAPITATPTATLIPSATPTLEPTSTQAYVPPTLIPTIDPTLLPGLLSNAFSIQTLEGVNGHNMQKVTGWDYGFGGGVWTGSCSGFYWLDTDHILLYPAIGEVQGPEGFWANVNVVPQPAVINFESRYTWLPRVSQLTSPLSCNRVNWSRELGIIIRPGSNSSAYDYSDRAAIFTYTFDGQDINYYWGKLLAVSPSGTKILVDDDTIIDLANNKIIELAWYMNYDQGTSNVFWSSDETRIYRCCHQYADITNGRSYSFDVTELLGTNGKPARSTMLPFSKGQWVRNDTHFLVEWSWVDDGDIRYLPMFDPAKKIIYDVREMAKIPSDSGCPETSVSPNGIYLWLECWDGTYLINLETFSSQAYPNYIVDDIEWSGDGKFAWVKVFNTNLWQILSVSSKEFTSLSVHAIPDTPLWWHPTDNALAYISEDGQKMELLNAQTMSNQELALPATFHTLVWNPSGEHIALVAEDGSLWQVDYPKLEKLEQLTTSLPDVSDVNWSPDGNSIAFVSGSDIYIVETSK